MKWVCMRDLRVHRYGAVVLGLLLLGGCAHMGTPMAPQNWRAGTETVADFNSEGRLAVKIKDNIEDKGSYANFDWRHQGSVQTINVNTPLGNTVGQLCQDAQGVLAVSARGEVFQASSAEELSQNLLGFSLPLQHLHRWAAGQWATDVPHRLLPDGRLQQGAWLISRQVAADGTSPRVLILDHQKLNIRLVFDQFAPETEAAPTQCEARTGAV